MTTVVDLTYSQDLALQAFKVRWSLPARCRAKGFADWRDALHAAWWEGWDATEPMGAYLRQMRNELGPGWLAEQRL